MPPVPCMRETHGRCFICDRIDPESPDYSEHYRRLFHPEEFPEIASEPTPAPDPPRIVEPDPTPPAAMPSVPLAGDLVAALTAAIGVDRLAKWVAKQLGTDCGCSARQAKMNALDAKARRYLARLGGGKTG